MRASRPSSSREKTGGRGGRPDRRKVPIQPLASGIIERVVGVPSAAGDPGRDAWRRTLRRLLPCVVVAIGVTAMAGCESSSPRATATGTLVLVNPSGVGGSGAPGSVEARQVGSDKTTRVATDEFGRFRLKVAPGTYTFVGYISLPGMTTYCTTGQPMQLVEGRAAEVNIQCKAS